MLTLFLALMLVGPQSAGSEVELSGTRARELQAIAPLQDRPVQAVIVSAREVELERRGHGLALRVRWQLDAPTPTWFEAALAAPSVQIHRITVNGRPAGAGAPQQGNRVAVFVRRPTMIEIEGYLAQDPGHIAALDLLPAVRGTVHAPADLAVTSEERTAVEVAGTVWTGASSLRIGPRTSGAHGNPGAVLAQGRVAIGLTVDEGEVRGHARLIWELRQGRITQVAFTARGLGHDVRIDGPAVGPVRRDGDRVLVELRAPAERRVVLDVNWTNAVTREVRTLSVPSIELDQVARTQSTLEFARAGDLDLAVQMDHGQAIAPQALPRWGKDLVDSHHVAAFIHAGEVPSGKLDIVRFVPVPGPAVRITRALFHVVHSEQGRCLMRARFELHNERAPLLRAQLPANTRVLGVEVAGAPVSARLTGQELQIPIKRSLETVKGLMSIPVVMTLACVQAPWTARDRREVQLVSVDAPIDEILATVALPRGYRSSMKPGKDGLTAVHHRHQRHGRRAKSAGLERSRDASAADLEVSHQQQSLVDRAVSEATAAYQRNDFDAAQAQLDQLQIPPGPAAEQVDQLQSNLDLIRGPRNSEDISAVSDEIATPERAVVQRRVKAQAQARALERIASKRQHRDNAKQLRAEGKYKQAEDELRQAQEANDDLRRLETDADAVYDFNDVQIAGEMEATREEAQARDYLERAERGFGAAHLAGLSEVARRGLPHEGFVSKVLSTEPLIALPNPASDTLEFSFSLWAPDSAHALTLVSRRHRRDLNDPRKD